MVVYRGGKLSSKRITKIVVKKGVLVIDDYAFSACPNIRSITIPNSVTSIRECAFHGLEHLETISIPDSVKTIGRNAFYGCTSLKAIVIPEGVTVIESYTFLCCRSLKSITFPKSLTKIGRYDFEDCQALEHVHIPKGIKETAMTKKFEIGAFQSCCCLQKICIPNGIEIIAKWLFYGCTSLHTVTLPPTIEEFGFSAFRMCNNLNNFSIPNGLPALKDGFDPFSVGLTSHKLIKQILVKASSLTSIHLRSYKDDDLPNIFELVSSCPTLRKVDLSRNSFSVGVFETLASQDIPGHLRLLEIKDQFQKWEKSSSSPEHLLLVLERNPKLVIETDKFWDDSEDGKICHQLDMNEYGCRSFTVRDSRWPELIETLALLEKEGKLRTGASNILYNLFHLQLNVILNYPQDDSSTDKKNGRTSVKRARLE